MYLTCCETRLLWRDVEGRPSFTSQCFYTEDPVGVGDSDNPLAVAAVKQRSRYSLVAEVSIVTGPVVNQYLPIYLESEVGVISFIITGYTWFCRGRKYFYNT